MKFTTQVLLFSHLNTISTKYFNDQKLKMNENNTFKIMQITDIHYGEKELCDEKTTQLMKNLIDWEKPDLAVLTGDMVSGYAWDHSEGWYQKQWLKWTEAFETKQ